MRPSGSPFCESSSASVFRPWVLLLPRQSVVSIENRDGVFDDLMEAMNSHLDAQFKLGRITGTDFSTVYLGAMQSAIQQAVAL